MSKNDMQKIVITGAGGFLGSNLVDAMTEESRYFVYALSSRRSRLQQINKWKNIQYDQKDIVFSRDGNRILRDAIVVNCAFPRNSLGTEMADGLRYIQKLFSRSQECGVKAIINISSQSVYSLLREEPATEETLLSLGSAYAVGKYATELILESVCRGTEISYTNLRMSSLIGPGFNQRVVNRLVKQMVAGETICVIKDKQKFGFMDIEDAVRAILAILNVDVKQWKPIYNVGNGREYGMEYIAQRIKYVLEENGVSIPQINVKNGDESSNTGIAYRLFYEDTGFEPIVELDVSIQKILDQLETCK